MENEMKTAKRTPGRRPLAEWQPEDTRREIRRHAIRLFNEQGYAAVSIGEIAKSVGVTRATLYYHYRSKAEIFVESARAVMEFILMEVRQITQQETLTVRERLCRIVRRRREMDGAALPAPVDEINESMMAEAMALLEPEFQGQVMEMMGELHQLTHALMAEGITRGELRPLPVVVLDFAFWQLFPADGYPDHLGLSRGEIEETLLATFFEGFAVP